MKKIILLALIASLAFTGYSQQQKRITYLTIWFVKKYDYVVERYYYIMNAEVGNSTAPEVFDLVIFKSENDLKNKNVDFYHKQNDSAKACFNYFTNPTAGLEYLGNKGWQLVSVTSEVTSEHEKVYETGEYQMVTKVTSTPKYYLKKELD